jgi:hypothetical protein
MADKGKENSLKNSKGAKIKAKAVLEDQFHFPRGRYTVQTLECNC